MSTGPNPAPRAPLVDPQGRRIVYLRLSLTDRCNFRCSYCSPGLEAAHGDALDRAAIRRLAAIFGSMGIRRVRLTGGEPTLRPDLVEVVRDLRETPGIEEIALTTNGHRLEDLAAPLREAGLRQLNVSLDTFDGDRLLRLSGRAADVERIQRGIAAAAAAGFPSLKINTVVLRGVNDGELGDLARFAWSHGAIARYIELMPFGGGEVVPVAEMQRLLEAQGVRLEPDDTRGWGPARHMRGVSEAGGRELRGLLGFIGAITENFCSDCNRVRVSAAGALRACLGGRDEVPLVELLRSGTDDEVEAAIREGLSRKRDRHHMEEESFETMVRIGG
ncbi:MAG TPA: GTP 3',8-cyclase MoaA [Anaeromyxobacteraceae bacterium]|nr:GTP 3',8-cyclase MoaA [Anaeromyxobacteraceae bacterium]